MITHLYLYRLNGKKKIMVSFTSAIHMLVLMVWDILCIEKLFKRIEIDLIPLFLISIIVIEKTFLMV